MTDNILISILAIAGIIGAVALFIVDTEHRDEALECKEAGGIFFNPTGDRVCLHPSSVIRLDRKPRQRL